MKNNNPRIYCACGCGGTLTKYDARGRERTFLPSHWSKIAPNQRTTVLCEHCGTAIERAPWHLKKVKHYFCNQTCAGAWATQNNSKKGENNGHYNSITVPCAGCGIPITKAYSLIMRRNNRVYCTDCAHLFQKGRKGFYVGYPKAFNNTLREKIRKRDQHTCQYCATTDDRMCVHHIDYDKHNNDPMNLIVLCESCHGRTNYGTEQWQGHFQQLMRERFPS